MLATLSAAQPSIHFEVDLIFHRSETYIATDRTPANLTSLELVGETEATPCMVVVDDTLVESIESEVPRLATPPEMPDMYKHKDEEDAARSVRPRVGIANAAVCAVGYMALASW